jgi:hypothetical protein
MRILAIDPGTTESGLVLFEDGKIIDAGVHDNYDVLRWVKAGGAVMLAIETMQANYAATVGASVIDTLIWVGRFKQAWREPDEALLISRQRVKDRLCGNVKAKDSGVRQALIDRLGPPGTKKAPGPTYGVTSHAWQALAVAVVANDMAAGRIRAIDD